jgi:hypothetical protein
MRRRGRAPAAQSDLGANTLAQVLRGHAITITLQDKKAARGTKRVCQVCDTRFYDLSRDPPQPDLKKYQEYFNML